VRSKNLKSITKTARQTDKVNIRQTKPLSGAVIYGKKARAFLTVIRPYQWIKNLLVFAPLFFSGNLFDSTLLERSAGAALMFCIIASAGYVFNDWKDREEDRNHPNKRLRPFAAGTLTRTDVIIAEGLLWALFLTSAHFMPPCPGLLIVLGAYFCMSLCYSSYFKKMPLLEIFMVSSFFVVRVIVGGLSTDIHVSNWLFSTVFFLSLLITIAKRKSEIITMGTKAHSHRASLAQYSMDFLNYFLWTIAGVSLMTYSIYTVESDHSLVFTILPATYGVIRFLYLTDSGRGADPIITLLKDAHLLVCTLVFLLFVCYKIYS